MTGIVLQARLGSTRLPGKALLPLGGSTVIEQVMQRLNLVPADVRVLATEPKSADRLGELAKRRNFELVLGPEDDVLARYCLAARSYGITTLLRATGDNPLVSFELARAMVSAFNRRPSAERPDYAAYTGMPLGMGVELVRAEALFRAEAEAGDKAEREHVCPYLYNHPELFAIDRRAAPAEYLLPEARLTIDLREDYEFLLRAYGALYDGRPIPSSSVLAWLKSLGSGAGP